jgi:DNA adenine methylase
VNATLDRALTRPLLRWYGGKWRLAPWIIRQLPPHRVYVEPFGGAGSVLLRKPRAYAEVYNDLDAEIVNLFRVLRDPADAERLIAQLRLTPYARSEFEAAFPLTEAPVERARRLVVLAFMGFGSNAHCRHPTGFRSNARDGRTTVATEWAGYPDALAAIVARLAGVIVESRPAIEIMARYDAADALFYVDPPYVWDTRLTSNGHHPRWRGYAHEMSDDDHRALIAFLRGARAKIALSGYAHPIYDDGLAGWTRLEAAALADGARPRTEVLWLNPAAAAAGQGRLMFGAAEDLSSEAPPPGGA